MRVTLLTNLVPPYRTAAYDALHQRAKRAGGALRVLCTHPREPQRNWAAPNGDFECATLPGVHIPLGENRSFAIPFGVIRALGDTGTDALILAGFGIAQWQAQNWALMRSIPTILQFDGWSGSDAVYANPVRRKLRNAMIARANGFVAASSRGAAWFKSHGIAPDAIKIAPIPPSFKLPAMSSRRAMADRQYDLLWCGRTTRSKGFDVFIRVATKLAQARTIHQIAIIGSTDIEHTTQRLISAGLFDLADVFGQLPPDQLPPYLGKSKIALFPSRNDAYGVGVIDAIKCGAVALASPMVGCAADVLRAPETLSTDDPEIWVGTCQRLLGNADLWQRSRQSQITATTDNTAQHHSETIWQAVIDAAHRKSAGRQWG